MMSQPCGAKRSSCAPKQCDPTDINVNGKKARVECDESSNAMHDATQTKLFRGKSLGSKCHPVGTPSKWNGKPGASSGHVKLSSSRTRRENNKNVNNKVKGKPESVCFPNPCQTSVLQYLCEDFGLLQVPVRSLDCNNNVDNGVNIDTVYQWQGLKFPSVNALRTHLCQTGELVAPSVEWFHENMEPADSNYYFHGGRILYFPKTDKAKMIADWIRLDIIPEAHRTTARVELLDRFEVKKILGKIGVQAYMGYYNMGGESLPFDELERKFATCGFSNQLMDHPGATLTEKLSVLNYYLDFETM